MDSVEALPDRAVSEHPNFVTEVGLARIDAAIAEARTAHGLAQAASDRASMASAARELRYWSARRATAQVVAGSNDVSKVRFGATVTITRGDGREQTFQIVGEDEADPAQGSVSHVSPLARALLGKSIGDVVRAGNGDAEIITIA
ncbi:MAG: transcription elongation factor GreA [Bradyrhizobium sp.]